MNSSSLATPYSENFEKEQVGRVFGKTFVSKIRPTHETGTRLLDDGCEWTVTVTMLGCRFRAKGDYTLFKDGIAGKLVTVKTAQSQWFSPDFRARFDGPCDWKAESDLPGLGK